MNGDFHIFDAYPELVAGFSKKQDGDMRIASTDDVSSKDAREKFFRSLRIDPANVIAPLLVHGTAVREVTKRDAGSALSATDALMTNEPDVYLTVTAADCLPVYFYDPTRKVVALAHAGWRGLSSGILSEVLRASTETYGCNPTDMKVFIGTGICGKCYEVGEDLITKFREYSDAFTRKEDGTFLDLKKVAKEQLIFGGILDVNIETSTVCTYESSDECFSYRRDRPICPEAMLAVLGMQSSKRPLGL